MSDASTFFGLILAVAGGTTLLAADIEPAAGKVGSEATSAQPTLPDPSTGAGGVLSPTRGADGRLYLAGTLNGKPITFMLDTAANRTFISQADARSFGVRVTGTTRVNTVGGVAPAFEGRVQSFQVGSTELSGGADILIVPDLPHALLGMDVIRALDSSSIAL